MGHRPLGILIVVLTATGMGALEVPPLSGRINDNAGILSPSKENELERYLAGVENATGVQIGLLTIPSLEGDSLESYSLRVAERWGLGRSGNDDGAILLVAMEERKIRIEVGYGLEAVLTDATSGYIIREAIVPNFKSGDFEAGVAGGLQAMGGAVTGNEPIAPEDIRQSESRRNDGVPVPVFLIVFIVIFILTRMGGYRRYRRRGISPASALFMGMFLGNATRSGRRGMGSSYGGGFGGGFSGGGGGFGGGGASGGW